jgi:2-amino-4-hydroxy-6-hydroxymethyldihydropteridine diphosphokinase
VSERVGYIGLGSNVGDREAHLRGAIRDLESTSGVSVPTASSTYETEPVGEILEQPDFLNVVVRIKTTFTPIELLRLCKAIEVEHGRAFAGPRHGPRPIDLDLLLLGDLEMRTNELTLPHPEITSRRFVLEPLLELDPELRLPDGASLSEALASLGPGQRATLVGPPPG